MKMKINSRIKTWWWNLDKWILIPSLILIFVGIVLVYSSSLTFEGKYSYLIKKHLLFIPLSLFIIFFSTNLSVSFLVKISIGIFVFFLILTFFPSIYNLEIKGAKRWIKIFNITFQPSEFIKPTFFIISSLLLSRFKRKNDYSLSLNIVCMTLVGLALFSQPDFGMFILIFITWYTQIIITGLPTKILVTSIILGIVVSIISFFKFQHVKFRVENFLNGIGDNYQINKSLNSISNGGLSGKGLGSGNISKNLPDAHTDFIFSLAGEELGFFFLIFIISLYIIIFYRILIFLLREKNLFIFLSTSSLSLIFIFQSLINISSSLNLIPTKGMTLPFISYGGSSLISCSLIVGFILCLTKKQIKM